MRETGLRLELPLDVYGPEANMTEVVSLALGLQKVSTAAPTMKKSNSLTEMAQAGGASMLVAKVCFFLVLFLVSRVFITIIYMLYVGVVCFFLVRLHRFTRFHYNNILASSVCFFLVRLPRFTRFRVAAV
jgi:hypothetical protein